MLLDFEDLKKKVIVGVEKLGYSGEDAKIISEVLLYADMRGNNQGITKIATGGVPLKEKVEEMKISDKKKCGVLISGGHSMVASSKGADMAVELAEEHGVGVVCVNHTFTSSGAIGYFARKISKAGYIGFVCVGNGGFAAVAPHNSNENRLGTNPFAYAFPYEGGEVVFDAATAAIAYFGLVEAKLKGEDIPEGLAFDSKGELTTNPGEVLGKGDDVGAIKTFGGFKGFGLSLFVQLLGSAFSVAGIPGKHEADGAGTFILAIDPGMFAGKEEYMKRSRELIDYVKESRPLENKEVLIPGERGDRRVKEIESSGKIEIADDIWNKLCGFIED